MSLGQYHTPLWVCERLIDLYFPDLSSSDIVLEPSCGYGRFLQAIPETIPAVGVEIDPELAREAEKRTGRRVIVGDFCAVALDIEPTAIIGNPPFHVKLIQRFLERSHRLLPDGGRVGFILPAFAFQTAATVLKYSERWSIRAELMPRNCFHRRMAEPLLFAVFAKDARRALVGFALYRETAAVNSMHKDFRALLEAGRPYRSAWRAVVEAALEFFGGEAELQQIYRMVEGARPTANPFWQEKVRQIAQRHCVRTGSARYALATPREPGSTNGQGNLWASA